MSPKLIVYFLCVKVLDTWQCFGMLGNGFIFATAQCSRTCWAPTDLYFNNVHSQKLLGSLFNLSVESVQLNHKKIEFENIKDLMSFSMATVSRPKENAQRAWMYSQMYEKA